MKLNIVPARTGAQWVREGVRLFLRQPLALGGLFMMFIMVSVLLSMVPMVGAVLASALVPTFMVGLMAASREVGEGRFPMPNILFTALRQSPARTRAMIVLGGLYAFAIALILALTNAMDDGKLRELLAQHGGNITPELLNDPALQPAARASARQMMASMLLLLPVSVLFWHAPALVHWHDVPVGKSLFFSTVGVLRNSRAYLLYGLGWVMVSLLAWMALALLAGIVGSAGLMFTGLLPISIVVAAMGTASLWATFRDTFMASSDASAGLAKPAAED